MTHGFVEAHVTSELVGQRNLTDMLVTVRELVAQIMSNFLHIRREPERRLSRAARELDPGTFFDHFGDFFTDFQSRYLLAAFLPLAIEEQRRGFWACAMQHLPRVLDRIRWLVPTDRIDDFVPLWEGETGHRAAERAYATNHAPADGVDLPALEAAIRARPALFALDNVLYQYARTRFDAWANGVQQSRAPWDYPANASRVFHENGGGCGCGAVDIRPSPPATAPATGPALQPAATSRSSAARTSASSRSTSSSSMASPTRTSPRSMRAASPNCRSGARRSRMTAGATGSTSPPCARRARSR
jgi:hypothetical protein